MRFFILFFSILIYSTAVSAQMLDNGKIFFGHEWIDDDKTYFKIKVAEDGIYRIDYKDLINAGFPSAELIGHQLLLINRGNQVPIFVSTGEMLSSGDFIYFYGEKNRGEVDKYLYQNPETQQLNPEYSLFTDQNVYYLSWNNRTDNLRFEELSNNFDPNNLPPQERFYQHEEKRVFSDFHFKPTHNGRDFIRYSSYDEGEGFGSEIQHQSIVPFSLDNIYFQGTRPKVAARFAGTSSTHFIQTKINDLILNKYAHQGYGVNDFEFNFNFDHLSEEMEIEVIGVTGNKDRHSLAYISLIYPRTFDFNDQAEFRFNLSASFIPRYVEVENFDFGNTEPLLFDVQNDQFLSAKTEGELVKFILPASNSARRLLLLNPQTQIKTVSDIERFDRSLDLQNIGDYLIISNSELYQDRQSVNWVKEYADYRSSEQGGNYHATVINVNELYDLFAYGIDGHSLAIKNFINYLIDQSKDVKAVFIIGKGLEYVLFRKKNELNGRIKCFVPTFGSPGGDNLFTAKGFNTYPEIPIGRLAVQNPEEIKDYLEKVKAFERPTDFASDHDVLWRKRVLHLSGGSADIQDLLFGYLSDMKGIIENNYFGGDVFTFRKTTADLLQSSQTNDIIGKINDGVSIITFFGHAAVGTFDFSLEDPSRYDNQGKSPIIFSLGCHSGNVHSEGIGLSEDFVLEKDKGAIAFVASSGTAYINPQYRSGINFYNNIGDELKEKGIGEVIRNSLLEIVSNEDIENITLAQQLTIHGDPVLTFKMSNGPDYASRYEGFGIDPGILNSTQDSFDFSFEILNRGSYREEKIEILIEHVTFDGTVFYSEKIAVDAPGFSKSFTIRLPNPGVSGVGRNQLFLTIDSDNRSNEYPSEIAEYNNQIANPSGGSSYEFFILDNKAKPIYPEEFGILNDAVITVHASSDNGLIPLSDYILEIDTTELFDSPLLTREIIKGTNSVIQWEPDVVHLDGTVYYWRLSPKMLEDQESKWEQSSFLYAPGERDGWNQSHYYQWIKNNYTRLIRDTLSRDLSFDSRTWDIRVKNELFDPQDFWVFVNGTPWASLNPRQLAPVLSVFIWHPKDILFKNRGRDFGSLQFSSDAFLYRMNTPADRKNLAALLHAAPDGTRIFLHTILRDENSTLYIQDWANDKERIGLDLFEVMRSYGAKKFDLLKEKGAVPYTYIFDKGIGPVAEDIANSLYETIDLSSVGRTFWDDGNMTAKAIGPVRRFMQLEWEEIKEVSDNSSLIILGHHLSGQVDTLRKIMDDYSVNLTFIHPDEYPTISLEYVAEDSSEKTPAQLQWWRVYYQDLPDVAFDISNEKPNVPDTVESIDQINLAFGIKNISEEDIENFKIKYTITSESNQEFVYYSDLISLRGEEQKSVHFTISDFLPGGQYKLTIQLNAEQQPHERTYDNNIGVLQFYVNRDKRDPILEVKANGEFIAENDLLPPDSEFVVLVIHPASPFLLDDVDIFNIQLEYPKGKTVIFDENSLDFQPALSELDNRATALFRPLLDELGKYTLKVKAEDKVNNSFEPVEYEVSFLVNDQNVIKNVKIFPNPVSSYTQIDVELTGAELPADFAIHVFDAKGKKIGTISRSSFQNIKTGLNTRSHLWRVNGLNLVSGTYFLKIDGQKAQENVSLSKKIVLIQ